MSHSKAPLGHPTAPLTILTHSPSTLHAFFPTLLALQDLTKEIFQLQPGQVQPQEPDASNNREPFLSDTFTLIAGTGLAGGILALFLGRFRLSIWGALLQWHALATIGPQLILRNFHFPIRQFVALMTKTKLNRPSQMSLEEKGIMRTFLEPKMFLAVDEETRCRHVVVVGAAEKGFEQGSKQRKKIMTTMKKKISARRATHRTYNVADKGASDPRTTKILSVLKDLSDADPFGYPEDVCAARRTMEVFLGENSQDGVYRTVMLALEEAWTLYGKDVRIAAIVDVGDRFEEEEKGADVGEVARCLFPPAERQAAAAPIGTGGGEDEVKDGVGAGGEQNMAEAKWEDADSETTTVCYGGDSVQRDVKGKLREVYGEDAPPFYRLKAQKC
ncbi:MAG: hypothetical protein Q9203_005955 [Teloschistes exilis]